MVWYLDNGLKRGVSTIIPIKEISWRGFCKDLGILEFYETTTSKIVRLIVVL